MMATFTPPNECANARVSSKRQRYSSVTASTERLCANRVFTAPGRGALAMMTRVRLPLHE